MMSESHGDDAQEEEGQVSRGVGECLCVSAFMREGKV